MDRDGNNFMKAILKQFSRDGLFPFKDILNMFFFVFGNEASVQNTISARARIILSVLSVTSESDKDLS